MKIVIVVNSAWAAYNFRINLAKGLEKAGYKVIFVWRLIRRFFPISDHINQ